MTPHMIEFIRTMAHHAGISGPVLEIGSYIEVNQDHLNFRTAFPEGTPYVGVDVLEGPGVDRQVDLLNEEAMSRLVDEVQPKVVLCLYVLEHVWDIVTAARILGNLWRRNPESWLWIATHQNQPYHGTAKYGDYWRLTASGLKRLMEESGVDEPKVFTLANTNNPEDILAVRQPRSQPWPGEAMTTTSRSVSVRWDQYC